MNIQDEKTNEEKQAELEADFVKLVAPLILWLDENFHDFVTVTVNSEGAELAQGLMGVTKESLPPASDSLH